MFTRFIFKFIIKYVSLMFLIIASLITPNDYKEQIQDNKDIVIEKPLIEEINKDTSKINEIKNDKNFENVYIIGDSRSVGMEKIDENSNHFYTAKIGQGYNYLTQNIDTVLKSVTKNDCLIINLGVNDLYNVKKYVSLINNIQCQGKIYVMSVNPVDEEKESKFGYSIKNTDIENFNDTLVKTLKSDITMIDTNTYLINSGFNTVDGLHYSNDTYEKILEQMHEEIKDGN